ncbi:MAG TPA: 6-bladed beta-propeller [Actinobacteria bacterium]|nr:6-bladed beta-propeller [Actinomycetota bacterium]
MIVLEKIKSFIKVRWKSISIIVLIALLLAVLLALIIYYYGFQNSGQDLKNGPMKYLFSVGEGEGECSLKGPLAAAISESKIYVADSVNGKVKVFTSKGSFLFSFAVPSDQSVAYLAGIMVGPDRNIYVSEVKSQRLMVFDSRGKYLYDFPKKRKVIIKPIALFYLNQKFYVTDVGDHTVKVFDLSGNLLKKIGKGGNGIGEFSYPNGVAVDKDGKIYVSDSNNSRIQVFDANGKFIFKIGGQSSSKKILHLPRGIIVDSLSRIHVADPFAHEVLVFDKEGKHLFSYGQEENILVAPNGITFGPEDKNIYVTDRINNTVKVWTY